MKKLLNKFTAVILLVGILAACETSDPLIKEAKTYLVLQNFDEAIALLDQSIEKNPESGVPYYYKAMTYSDQAVTIENPDERKPLYRNFRENIEEAREKFEAQEKKPDEAGQVDNLVISVWSLEHNTAIQYATNDSIMQMVEEPFDLAASHLENAIIVNPDSSLSYEVLGQVYYLNERPEDAIRVQKKAMELKNTPESSDFARLSDYFARAEKFDSTVLVLNQGLEMYPDSINLSQKLADAYMSNGMRDSSIAVIERLIQVDPENTTYRLALGTRLLQATDSLNQKIEVNYDQIFEINSSIRNANQAERDNLRARADRLMQENLELQGEIDSLSEYAEQELLKVVDDEENAENAYNALGIIYQNKAAALFDLRNNTEDIEESNKYDEQAKDALRQAMDYYEQVVEINPNNQRAWQNLSNIYYTLDMREKAEEALQKAGNN